MPSRPPVHRPDFLPAVEPGAADPGNFERYRPSPRKRGYDWTWEKLRRGYLAANPLCRFHAERGEVVAATQVDHIETIEDRPDLRLTWHNLRGLCHSCHSTRTARDQAARHLAEKLGRR